MFNCTMIIFNEMKTKCKTKVFFLKKNPAFILTRRIYRTKLATAKCKDIDRT